MNIKKEAIVDTKQFRGLVHDRNLLFLACNETLNILNNITCMDKEVNKILNEGIVKLKKAIKVSKRLS